MIKVGNMLRYIGGGIIGLTEDELKFGDVFELLDIEETKYNVFYWMKGVNSNIIVTEREIGYFEVVI